MNIRKKNYSIVLSENGEILSLISEKKQFVKRVLPLLQFRLRDGQHTEVFTSNDADEIAVKEGNDQVEFTFAFKSAGVAFHAVLHFGQRIEGTLSYENHSGKYVEWIDFPQIAVPHDLVRSGGSGKLILNTNEGLLIDDLSGEKQRYPYAYHEMEYPSLGMNHAMFPAVIASQFLAYYDDTAGIYMAAEDSERSVKGVDYVPSEDAIKLQFRLYPGVENTETHFSLPYHMVVDFFVGDWRSAAELYRAWFEQNLPEGLLPIESNASLPEWYHDSPVVITYPVQGIHDMDEAKPNKLFPYKNALPYIDEIAAYTNSRIMTVLMHWESTAPWAPPYVWPPLGGEKLLSEFCEELHSKNHLMGVYCSGISYTIQSNLNDYNMQKEYDEKGLSRYMCAGPDGTIVSKTCQVQRTSYDMCVSQDFTKNVMWDEAEKMVTCGLDYIQILDQNHGGTPYLCYSDKHGHPAVPGKWMVEHMTELLKKLKSKVGNKVLLGCESAASEAYIPYLNLSDNRFNFNYLFGQPIPLYAYIYHKYLYNFSGNSVSSLRYIDIERSPCCYMHRMVHSFLAGDLLTLVINQDGEIIWNWGQRDYSYLPDRKQILDYIKTATAFRRGVGRKYLSSGEMIKPCDVKSEAVPIYKTGTEYVTEYPAVQTSAWQASDGTRAQFLASYRKQEETCTVDLTGTNGAKLVDEQGHLVKVLENKVCEITVPASSVLMIQFD